MCPAYRLTAIVLIIYLLAPIESLQDASNQCPPDIALKFPFDLSQFLGVWYEIARFPRPPPLSVSTTQKHADNEPLSSFVPSPPPSACIRLVFTLKDDGKLRIERSGVDTSGKWVLQLGEALQSQTEHAQLFFKFPPEDQEESIAVIAADYEEHALLYGCNLTSNGLISQDALILGREPTLGRATSDILKGILASRHVDGKQFVQIRQDNACLTENPDNSTLMELPSEIGV